jgi:gliding motility-associated-like protein
VRLTDYQDWRISVLGPPPINLTAEPIGSGINLTWGYPQCNNAAGYRIYRKTDSIGYVAPVCETGIPDWTGYQLVGSTVGAASTSFFDSDNGLGLISGQRYCYMVYAYFDDGAESYPSFEACATLLKEVPIITRVSVNTTNLVNGSDTIKWAKPTQLDPAKHPGPYQYKLLRKTENTDYVEIATSIIDNDLNNLDTVYVDNGLNTQEEQYTYRVEIYGNEGLIGPSRPASSPWLKAKPLDNRLELSLRIDVPWVNETMYVYRQQPDNSFVFLDSANTLVYTDSNLINGQQYCYYVTTKGGYSDPELEYPLWNNSQILCAIPEDKQAPCAPQSFNVDSDCEQFFNHLDWLNPNVTCDTTDDVVSYNIYYRSFAEGDMEFIQKIDGPDNITFEFNDLKSVAGCYAISAVDSFGNESPLSEIVCVDNCPVYELPNVFTPGVDGQNDFFKPHRGWRYVESIELQILNRWGEEVYSTTNPDIDWDGSNKEGEALPDGTYFYICKVFEIRLEGIVERDLKGTVTLLREKEKDPSY